MAEVPILVVKIPSYKLLSRGRLCVVLQSPTTLLSLSTVFRVPDHVELVQMNIKGQAACGTRAGKTFSAARRGIEKPPWVLVSLAVNVLQK